MPPGRSFGGPPPEAAEHARERLAAPQAERLRGQRRPPCFCAGAENGLLLGYLMYRTRLVPRPIAVLGLVGGSLAVASAIAELFGLYQQVSAPAAIVVFPEALFGAALGSWLTVKGFRPSPVIQDPRVLQDAGRA